VGELPWSSGEEEALERLHQASDHYERNVASFRKLRREGGYALRSWFITLHKAEQVRRYGSYSVQPIVHTSCIHRAYIVHTSCIHRAYIVHTSCIHRAFVDSHRI
jgi:hypothetical protein